MSCRKQTGLREQVKAVEVLKRQTRHVLFTEPTTPQAGQDMTVYYNPSNTGLNGCLEIYITVSTLSLFSRSAYVP